MKLSSSLVLSLAAQKLAAAVDQALTNLTGTRIAYVLVMSADHTAQYVSNADRKEGVAMIEDLLERWKAGRADIPAHYNPDLPKSDSAPVRRIYISGPMTGIDDLNFPAFYAAAARLKDAGFKPCNPADLNPDPTTPRSICLRNDIKALCDCDGLALLPGWESSAGAHLELNVAYQLAIPVATLSAWLPGS